MSKSKRGKSGGDPAAKWDEGLVNEQLQSVCNCLESYRTYRTRFVAILILQDQWQPLVAVLEPGTQTGCLQAVEEMAAGVKSGSRRRFLLLNKQNLIDCVSTIKTYTLTIVWCIEVCCHSYKHSRQNWGGGTGKH